VNRRPRVAIAHDYLTQRGGAERVVLAMARAFPDAPVHTTLYEPEQTYPEFRAVDVRTSPINRVGLLRRHHRLALPLLAPAAEATRIDADVVLASSSGWAHGFRTSGRLLVYCHTPARWLYHAEDYLGERASSSLSSAALTVLGPPLRRWDRRAARRADAYLANSRLTRDRVDTAYGIRADVLPPPHGVTTEGTREPVPEIADWPSFHLIVSRLLPYKNVDVAVDAFRSLDQRLLVIGSGPMLESLRRTRPPNVHIATGLADAQMRWAYARASALVAPGFEDFGLTPLEAAAFGKPTIALRAGGYLDTVVEGRTGVFVEAPTAEQLRDGVRRAAATSWDPELISDHAATFAEDRFAAALRERVAALCPV